MNWGIFRERTNKALGDFVTHLNASFEKFPIHNLNYSAWSSITSQFDMLMDLSMDDYIMSFLMTRDSLIDGAYVQTL